jgi:hypothetical protein
VDGISEAVHMVITYICSTCGSDDVCRDAWAEWSVKEQEWTLRSTYDDAHCERCECETRLIEVELHPPKRIVIQVHTTITDQE